MKRVTLLCLAMPLAGASVASASIANFDSFAEGDIGLSFTDAGITFFNLDDRATPGFRTFTIEAAAPTLSGPGFSPPNALGFGSWVPGPGAAFSQCGSFMFTTGSVQTHASIDVFEWLSPAGNIISLEAFRNGVLVASDSAVIPGNFQLNHWTLSVSGTPFDTLRVIGSGSSDRGIFIGLVDNVVVTPAPHTALVLAALLGRRRRPRPD
ncbi:MAG: hypothetical protein DYG92_14180 [Leptolyngbya sp. PLA1]|nr:hypothetical protein [Leptolyngbya sp. PLA1]